MTHSAISFDSLMAIDIGETSTRALLFDIVDGVYRFIAAGTAPSTIGLPYRNALEGARLAIDALQEITGRELVGSDERLIIPSMADGSGVDSLAVILSGGPALKVIVAGLLEDVSVDSARRLAETTYATVVDVFSMNDRRKVEARLDAIMQLRPDMVLIAGGTEGGAVQSIARLIEPIRLACTLLPEELRPQILYAGNQQIGEKVKNALEKHSLIEVAPNVRPALDGEQIEAAHATMASLFRSTRTRQMPGLEVLDTWSGGALIPKATAFGRIIRFLSIDDPAKGVLGVDVGVGSTTMAVATGGKLSLGVYPEYGLGRVADHVFEKGRIAQVMEWLAVELPEDYVIDYLYNKTINPTAIPTTADDLAIEQALARSMIRQALMRLGRGVGLNGFQLGPRRLLPPMEPIIAAGIVLTDAPTTGQTLMMLLDALQPTGITTVILDRNNLSAALGAAARVNPTLAVQVLDSGTFANLGTIISPVSNARAGTPILRVQISYKDSGDEVKTDIKQGSLEVLPLAPGQVASLYLKPFHRADIGMGPGRGGKLNRVAGGSLGVVIDARGRPLSLPAQPERRREQMRKWLWTLGN
jgi:hypothetical protein